MAPFDRSHACEYYSISVETMAIYSIVTDIKRDIGRKSRFIFIFIRQVAEEKLKIKIVLNKETTT